jgi:hypothetical protein
MSALAGDEGVLDAVLVHDGKEILDAGEVRILEPANGNYCGIFMPAAS